MAEHNELGNAGELIAKKHLELNHYQIKERNWHVGKLEIDIIAEKDGILVIVEVKTRSTNIFEHPQEAITLAKIKKLVLATQEYIFSTNWQGETRFDVIAIIPTGANKYKIEHIIDAFLAPVN